MQFVSSQGADKQGNLRLNIENHIKSNTHTHTPNSWEIFKKSDTIREFVEVNKKRNTQLASAMGNWFSCFHSKKSKHVNDGPNMDNFDAGIDSHLTTDANHHIERQSLLN